MEGRVGGGEGEGREGGERKRENGGGGGGERERERERATMHDTGNNTTWNLYVQYILLKIKSQCHYHPFHINFYYIANNYTS